LNSTSQGRVAQEEPQALIVTVVDQNNTPVLDKKKITLYSFNGTFISEPLDLKSGTYKLTEFFVLDENNNIVYATPLEGSPLAYLVNDPLPMDFIIVKDEVTKISPEVIEVGENAALDFGYATFSFNVVETLDFAVGVFIYNPLTQNFELTPAELTITSLPEQQVLFNGLLDNKTSLIKIRDGFTQYKITVEKTGYTTYQHTLSLVEIKQFNEEKVFIITLLDHSLNQGLVAYYPFNGNANDESGNGFNAITHGVSSCTDRKGLNNSSYCFDGIDDYINIPHHEAFNLVSDFTISLWTEIAVSPELNGGMNDIIRKWSGNHEGYPFAIGYLNELADDNYEDKIIYARYDGQACGNGPTTYSPVIENGTFVHVVLLKEGNILRQYINNVLITEFTDYTDNSSCTIGNTTDVTIGCRGNMVRFFEGKIDDIRIYNRAITPVEVNALFLE
jgi:hypothetical protein